MNNSASARCGLTVPLAFQLLYLHSYIIWWKEVIKVDSEQKFDMVDMGPSPVPSFCCSTSCALRDRLPRPLNPCKHDSFFPAPLYIRVRGHLSVRHPSIGTIIHRDSYQMQASISSRWIVVSMDRCPLTLYSVHMYVTSQTKQRHI